MSENTKIWDALGKTDPGATKGFSRAGGFKGTSVKPMWVLRRLTEQFGPAGKGWGVNEPQFNVVNGDGEILVYCTVSAWHGDRANVLWGVGGDKVLSRRKGGEAFHDDEAFKKSFTDAVNNAFKSLGVAADIHMGLFDDDKYVASMDREFNAPPVISDRQRDELILLLDQLNIPVAEVLNIGRIKDLRDLQATRFDGVKAWINTRAAEAAAEKKAA